MGDENNLSYIAYDPAWGYEAMPPVPEIPLFELIRRTASQYSDKTALVSLDYSISYGDMEKFSDRLAGALQEMGVQKGDRVATLLPNCAQHVIAFHGIIKAGAVSVPCNVMMKGEELSYVLNDSGAKVAICLDVLYPLLQSVMAGTPVKKVITVYIKDLCEQGAWVPPLLDRDRIDFPGTADLAEILRREDTGPATPALNPAEDLALILYTAGTTGFPKGVMETHYNMVYNCLSHSHLMDLNHLDVNLQIMPMFHTSGYFSAKIGGRLIRQSPYVRLNARL